MKRRAVTKKISDAAKSEGLSWTVARQGANHEIFELDGLKIPVPRHTELGNRLAEQIWKECEPKLGEDWWK